MRELLRRLHYLLHRRRFDQELCQEMEFHRDMAAREGGGSFGNALRLREEARDAWGWTWLDRFFQDLGYAARMLRRSPGFAVAAVLTLALGIGVNVAAFGFFNLMVLKPLPVRDPATLLRFLRRSPDHFADNLPYPAVAFYREHTKTLSAVLALRLASLAVEGEEKPARAHFVTANFFGELGATAALGRTLDPVRDEVTDAEPVVVLGYGFWQRQFGSDPSVVGKTIRLNERPATVVGVARRELSSLSMGTPDLWAPITAQPYFVEGGQLLTSFSEGGVSVFMWGRLRPGLAPKAAEEDLAALAAELHRHHPSDIWDNESLPSEPGGYATRVNPPMYPVLAVVGTLCLLILVVACGNLGGLLLARGAAREREIGIRAAVGAGPGRLVRQLFTESLLLALLGSGAGLALGYVALRSLVVWTDTPAWLDPTPDWRVAAFALGVGFAAAILFGLTPALQVARRRHRPGLSRQILIGAQVAGSCVLLIVAGLLVRALDRAVSVHPGYEYEHVISIDPGIYNRSAAEAQTYLESLEHGLRGLPGVEAVSIATNPPLGNRWTVMKTTAFGRAIDIHLNGVDPAFFQTMSIPILRGRPLGRGETHAIVVSESLARRQWPAEDPVGKAFRMGTGASGADTSKTVVGVAGSARLVSPEDPDAVEIYSLAPPSVLPQVVMLVRTKAPPEGLVPFVVSTAKAVDAKVFPDVQLMKTAYQRKLAPVRYSALSATLLGLVALLLACVGIVGLVAYAVSQRTKEIGIRMALGARPRDVLSAVTGQLSRPVLWGLLAGVGAAAALSQILRRVLYGISGLDPVAYLVAIGVFLVAVALAALGPARRALRVDPMRALRYE